ncbi:MAG: AraC family transcriptional regulator [Eubacterium sp.]|nr:AraC family transcriptional regulator [Eubacterium sp.]
MDIFENDKEIIKLLDMVKDIPWLRSYVLQLTPETLMAFTDNFGSQISVNTRNNTVVEVRLRNEGMTGEDTIYCFAEPFPGINVLSGNMRGLDNLGGISRKDEETMVSSIHYCRSGRCEIMTNDGRYAYMKSGVLCLESHKYKRKNLDFHGEEYLGVEIVFNLSLLSDEDRNYLSGLGVDVEDLQERYDQDSEYYMGNVSDTLKAAEEELASLMESDTVDSTTLFLMVLRINNLIKNGHVKVDKNDFYLTKGQRDIVSQIRDELINHPEESIPVETFAKKYGVSVVSLNKYFSIMYGDTIHKYIRQYRMENAARLLRTTKKSIAEIAAISGYENQSKFGSVFKKKYGVSPLEYRRQNY